ncbi:MAG: c-type cytochrome [Myxococcota bacterium]
MPQVEMPPSTLTKTVSNAAPASVPSGNLRGDAASGRKLYLQYCASCHGEDGKGEGPVGRALQPKPADHTDSAYMGQLSDEHLFKVIQQGGAAVGKSPMMAPWGEVIPEPGIRDLIAYLRELSAT